MFDASGHQWDVYARKNKLWHILLDAFWAVTFSMIRNTRRAYTVRVDRLST
jgi:hypothetical protein